MPLSKIDNFHRHFCMVLLGHILAFMLTELSIRVCAAQPLMEVLDRIETSHSNNLQRLQTWHGKATVDFYLEMKELKQNQRAVIHFAADQYHNRFSYFGKYEKVGRQMGESVPVSQVSESEYGGLIVDGDVFMIDPTPGNTRKGKLIVRDFASKLNIGILSESFYPLMFFRLGDREISELFDSIRENWQSDWLNVTTVRQGTKLRLKTSNVLIPNAFTEYVFDLEKSGNLVEFTSVDSEENRHSFISFVEINSVWVPVKIQYDVHLPSKRERRLKTISFETSGVNAMIPESSFTLDFIRARPGDVIADVRTQQSYAIQGNASPKLASRDTRPKSRTELPAWKLAILGTGIMVLFSIIGYLFCFSVPRLMHNEKRRLEL